ncbi:MAG: hypothetical protein MGF17_07035 [Trichodesmium sp. MAG_R04]|nr:hypothetical protein [Trichodesmium sp. MAG_R04]
MHQIIIWHPLIALIIASVFIKVKHQFGKQDKLATKNLLATVAGIFLIFSLLGWRFGIYDIFGLLLGCLFVAILIFDLIEEIN